MMQGYILFSAIFIHSALSHSRYARDDDAGMDFGYFTRNSVGNNDRKCLETVYEWRDLEYEFPSPTIRQLALQNGQYVPGNGVPIDVDVFYGRKKKRTFITIPRFTTGIPYSLAVVSKNGRGPNGPLIEPYPDYTWHSSTHNGQNCDGITSVFRVSIDPCGQLWVMDTGRINETQYCPPQILIFNLRNDKLVHRYKIPADQYTSGESLFITPIVDTRDPPPGNCANAKVYIADVLRFGLIVYDSLENKSWRVEHDTMGPNSQYGTITIAGESFQLMDGILGMSVSPSQRCGRRKMGCNQERYLYYHALANNAEVRVPLEVLDDEQLWLNNPRANANSFMVVGTRNTQSTAEAMDSNGNLYFGLINPIAIGSWNIQTPWNGGVTPIITDPIRLQFTSGLKVKKYRDQEELWSLSCRFQKVMTGSLNTNEINFRIQGAVISEIQQGQC